MNIEGGMWGVEVNVGGGEQRFILRVACGELR